MHLSTLQYDTPADILRMKFEVGELTTRDDAAKLYRKLVRYAHPDVNSAHSDSGDAMALLNETFKEVCQRIEHALSPRVIDIDALPRPVRKQFNALRRAQQRELNREKKQHLKQGCDASRHDATCQQRLRICHHYEAQLRSVQVSL